MSLENEEEFDPDNVQGLGITQEQIEAIEADPDHGEPDIIADTPDNQILIQEPQVLGGRRFPQPRGRPVPAPRPGPGEEGGGDGDPDDLIGIVIIPNPDE